MLFLHVMHHCLARCKEAFAVGVARAVRHIADHVLHDLVRRLQTKNRQIADIELDDLVAFVFHLTGLVQHRPADVIADTGQLAGLGDWLQTMLLRTAATRNLEFNHRGCALRPPSALQTTHQNEVPIRTL